MHRALVTHWPEYLMEAAELALFMLAAGGFATVLYHPASPAADLAGPALQRGLMGIAMGLTAVAIIYSPWGQQSGAHLNPAVTLTFLRLGKLEPWDAVFYVLAQAAGGLAAMLALGAVAGETIGHPSVNYVVTVPGPAGAAAAFAAEAMIAFVLMRVVLAVSSAPRLARLTGLCAGAMVAAFITLEAPFSGMSMNPARTLASAVPAGVWTGFWIYATAPLLGMLAAAEVHVRRGRPAVACAKLNHWTSRRCIFRCAAAPAATGDAARSTADGGAPARPIARPIPHPGGGR
jgi:aquaporin Z